MHWITSPSRHATYRMKRPRKSTKQSTKIIIKEYPPRTRKELLGRRKSQPLQLRIN